MANVMSNDEDNADYVASEQLIFANGRDGKPGNGKLDFSEESYESRPASVSCCCRFILKGQSRVRELLLAHKTTLLKICLFLLLLGYLSYFIYACYLDWRRAQPLIILNALVVFWCLYTLFKLKLGEIIFTRCWTPFKAKMDAKWSIIKWLFIVATLLLVVVVTTVVIGNRPKQYVGISGLLFFTFLLFITSHAPSKVNWRPVLWGMLLNYIFAVCIIKIEAVRGGFEWLGRQVTIFLSYTDYGTDFVFGPAVKDHFFAFKILPTIVFFSCVISLLYYMGVMQVVIQKIAFLMQMTMGTSATESLSGAGNIFVGQTEAPILIRPFLPHMTKSELHAVMTGGFATIAGGVLAAYIQMKIDAVHLICASVMNAPMALAVSKLTYPEVEKSVSDEDKAIVFEKPAEKNLVEAAAAGASQSIGLVANIAANLLAFLSLLAFINQVLSWIGNMVDFPELSFELICSYLFWIFALLMGVDPQDCQKVAELLGTKIVINEFVAYQKLNVFIDNRSKCVQPYISKRSEVIITYALCGFANLSSVGVQLGGIGAMAPSRRADLAVLVMRALFAGTVTTLMTACIAGMLVTDYSGDPCLFNNTASILGNGTFNGNGTFTP